MGYFFENLTTSEFAERSFSEYCQNLRGCIFTGQELKDYFFVLLAK